MKQIHLDEEARGRPVANNLNCGVAGLWNADAVRRLYFGGAFKGPDDYGTMCDLCVVCSSLLIGSSNCQKEPRIRIKSLSVQIGQIIRRQVSTRGRHVCLC